MKAVLAVVVTLLAFVTPNVEGRHKKSLRALMDPPPPGVVPQVAADEAKQREAAGGPRVADTRSPEVRAHHENAAARATALGKKAEAAAGPAAHTRSRTVEVQGVRYKRQRTPGTNFNCLIFSLAQALGVDCDADLARTIRKGMLQTKAYYKSQGVQDDFNPYRSVTEHEFLEPHDVIVEYILGRLLRGSTTKPKDVAVHIYNPDPLGHGVFQVISTSPDPSSATTHLYLHNDYTHFESMTPI
jgi:hypothetical protein